MSLVCATRALKNAKHIQSVAPHIIPAEEPPEGFFSLIPFEVLSRLHQMSDEELNAYPHLLDAARSLQSAQLQPRASLFKGVLHFVQITFNDSGAISSVSDADMQTMIQFGTLAAEQIAGYAAQYGSNRLDVSPTMLKFSVDVTPRQVQRP